MRPEREKKTEPRGVWQTSQRSIFNHRRTTPTCPQMTAKQCAVQRRVAVALHGIIGVAAVLEKELGDFWSVVLGRSVQRSGTFHAVGLLHAVLEEEADRLEEEKKSGSVCAGRGDVAQYTGPRTSMWPFSTAAWSAVAPLPCSKPAWLGSAIKLGEGSGAFSPVCPAALF